eukprot:1157856-Pelagomonas_calceolata.AAC.4
MSGKLCAQLLSKQGRREQQQQCFRSLHVDPLSSSNSECVISQVVVRLVLHGAFMQAWSLARACTHAFTLHPFKCSCPQ